MTPKTNNTNKILTPPSLVFLPAQPKVQFFFFKLYRGQNQKPKPDLRPRARLFSSLSCLWGRRPPSRILFLQHCVYSGCGRREVQWRRVKRRLSYCHWDGRLYYRELHSQWDSLQTACLGA